MFDKIMTNASNNLDHYEEGISKPSYTWGGSIYANGEINESNYHTLVHEGAHLYDNWDGTIMSTISTSQTEGIGYGTEHILNMFNSIDSTLKNENMSCENMEKQLEQRLNRILNPKESDGFTIYYSQSGDIARPDRWVFGPHKRPLSRDDMVRTTEMFGVMMDKNGDFINAKDIMSTCKPCCKKEN